MSMHSLAALFFDALVPKQDKNYQGYFIAAFFPFGIAVAPLVEWRSNGSVRSSVAGIKDWVFFSLPLALTASLVWNVATRWMRGKKREIVI
jgi:hypothetical protein